METFKEKINVYDAMPEIHYYLYKSCRSWQIDVIKFNDISEIKNDYYKDKVFYDTFAEADAARDKLIIEDEYNNIAAALDNME